MGIFQKLNFIAIGVRLHAKELLLKLLGKFKEYDYCLSFPTIQEGLRAEKAIDGLSAVSIPIPNEIFKECGVGILVKESDLKLLLEKLEKENVAVSGIFKMEGKTFTEVKEWK